MEIYDRLLQFPLFQGMSHADLMQVAGHTKFEFSKLSANKRLIRADASSDHLVFITAGALAAETWSDGHTYRVVEQVKAPYTIPPVNLFGLTQRHPTSYQTLAPCNVIALDKQEVLLLLDTQLVFRLNMLNMLATETQRLRHSFWRQTPKTLSEHLVRFLFSRCIYPAGPKTFYILMRQLGQEVNASRTDISMALNEMQERGLLTLHRGRIEVPSMERLLM